MEAVVSDLRVVNDLVKEESRFLEPVLGEVEKVIVGQKLMVERILTGLLTGGHILIEGVPGLAKTLTVKTFSQVIDAHFQRIQFTPDLLPADVLGTMIYNQHTGQFTTRKGPIFANLILADEINRAPAKVQSALLEAMQEKQVTIGDTSHVLTEPFIVLATQNPIEQEGTYPLPEAQVDRFMLKIVVGYPTRDEEIGIIDRVVSDYRPDVEKKATIADILRARSIVNQVYVDEKLKGYIVDIVEATRHPDKCGLKELTPYIQYGASPRASIFLYAAARAHAFIRHRGYVIPDDIKAIGPDVLRHRIVLTYEAEAEEVTTEDLVRRVFESVEVP